MLSHSSGVVLEKRNNLMTSLLRGNVSSALQNRNSRFAGVAWGNCQRLLGFFTPAVLSAPASRFAGKALNVQGIAGLFSEQRTVIADAVSSGLNLPDNHKEGDRWYGKTHAGEWMTEAAAIKGEYRRSK